MVPRAEDVASYCSGQANREIANPHSLYKSSEPYIVPYIEHGAPHSSDQFGWPRHLSASPDTSRHSGFSQPRNDEIRQYRSTNHLQPSVHDQYRKFDRKNLGWPVLDRRGSTVNGTQSRNETLCDSMTSYPPKPSLPMTQRKRKKGALKLAFRRLFGRRSTVAETTSPRLPSRHQSAPVDFITSATQLPSRRSASVPSNEYKRSAALGSHDPAAVFSSPPRHIEHGLEPSPPGPLAEHRSRPRRATEPGEVIGAQITETDGAALGGLGLQMSPHGDADERNIGFAVTSGSNPKRRSRSAGALHEQYRDHRMSPIQWRRWRRRSDEIQYWRDSIGLFPTASMALDSPVVLNTPQMDVFRDVGTTPSIGDRGAEGQGQNFNFGTTTRAMSGLEKISLEERVITLEVKLMDLEYAISKLQSRSRSPDDRSRRHDETAGPSEPRTFPSNPPEPGSIDLSSKNQSKPDPTPIRSIPSNAPFHIRMPSLSKPRPISVATTVRLAKVQDSPSPTKHSRFSTTTQSDITSMSTDHYSALVALISREQSARMRLETQVDDLRRQITSRKVPRHVRSGDDIRARFHGEHPPYARRRSSAYSKDTDEGGEVYQTPTERVEFEREVEEGEEGVAF